MTDRLGTYPGSRAAMLVAAAALSLAACQGQEAPPSDNQASEPAAPPLPAPADNASAATPANEAASTEAVAPAPKAPPPPAAAPWSPSGYKLIGTEPFWGGTVTGSRILYKTPDNQAGEPVAATADFGAGREVYRGTLGGKPFVLTLTRGPCSDGMSDNVHAFMAKLQLNGETRQGCADPQ